MNRRLKTLLALALVILVAGAFAGDAVKIKVKVSLANVRKFADMAAPVLLQVPQGMVLDVVEKVGDWYKVSLSVGGAPTPGFLHTSVVDETVEVVTPAPKTAPAYAPPVAAPPAGRQEPASRIPQREPAYGQPSSGPKLFVMLGYQMGFATEASTVDYTQPLYQETAAYSLAYNLAKGGSIDAAVGYRVGASWGVKLGGSITSRNFTETTTFSVPHPLWMATPREGTIDGTGMSVSETDLFLNLFYSFKLGPVAADIYGGPCYVLSTATIVTAITNVETGYPYLTNTVSQTTAGVKGNAFGFDAGLSLGYQFGSNFGVYLDARYVSAKATYATGGGIPDLSATLGGLRAGGGLKVMF